MAAATEEMPKAEVSAAPWICYSRNVDSAGCYSSNSPNAMYCKFCDSIKPESSQKSGPDASAEVKQATKEAEPGKTAWTCSCGVRNFLEEKCTYCNRAQGDAIPLGRFILSLGMATLPEKTAEGRKLIQQHKTGTREWLKTMPEDLCPAELEKRAEETYPTWFVRNQILNHDASSLLVKSTATYVKTYLEEWSRLPYGQFPVTQIRNAHFLSDWLRIFLPDRYKSEFPSLFGIH